MEDLWQQLQETTTFLQEKGVVNPQTGVILGTGLHQLLDLIKTEKIIPYSDIPNFPVSTVEFHKGNLVYGDIGGRKVLVMQGRFHAYEGYSMQQIVFPVRVMKLLGIQNLLLSNAAGGINLDFKKGDLVLLSDHINLQSGNPLTGKNSEALGSRFPDMSEPYSTILNDLLLEKSKQSGLDLKAGVYAAVNGPILETRAEYRYLKIIGADMVGMSTVPEVIAAKHMNLPCAGVSVITDECDPDNLKTVDISEIIAVAGKADNKLGNLFYQVIANL